MARVPYLSKSDLPAGERDLLDRDINLNRALVNTTSGTRALWTLGKWIRYESKLDPRLRELAILQIGYLVANQYEFTHHIRIGLESGLSERDIDDLAEDTVGGTRTSLSELDRLVLAATRESVRQGAIGAETFERLRTHLDDERLVELTIIVSFYIGVVHLLPTLEIDLEPEYLGYLDRFPLPR